MKPVNGSLQNKANFMVTPDSGSETSSLVCITTSNSISSHTETESGISMHVDLPEMDIKLEPMDNYPVEYARCSCACSERIIELQKELDRLNNKNDLFFKELTELKLLLKKTDDKPNFTITSLSNSNIDDTQSDIYERTVDEDFDEDDHSVDVENVPNTSSSFLHDNSETNFRRHSLLVEKESTPNENINQILQHVQKNSEMLHILMANSNLKPIKMEPVTVPVSTQIVRRAPAIRAPPSNNDNTVVLPVTNIKDLNKFNRKLGNRKYFEEMSNKFLPLVKDSGLRRECRILMEHLINYDVAVLFNWTGQNPRGQYKRLAFRAYRSLCMLIEDTLQRRCNKTQKEVHEAIKMYFKKAIQRHAKQ